MMLGIKFEFLWIFHLIHKYVHFNDRFVLATDALETGTSLCDQRC